MDKINISKLECPQIEEVIKDLSSKIKDKNNNTVNSNKGTIWVVTDEIKPVDLYCYFYARFGKPNGFQMLLKNDDSDNLIHWHYTFKYGGSEIEVMCMNFRIEIMHRLHFSNSIDAKNEFIKSIKEDFSKYGRSISEVRKKIEKWHVFINPYFRLKSVIEFQLEKLESLKIDEVKEFTQPVANNEMGDFEKYMNLTGALYTEATSLGLSIRMIAPVFAESFINLLIFLLAEDDIKEDKRQYDSFLKQPIDLRIKGLHRHCKGFAYPIDYSVDCCKQFHSLMNNRNDLLHGNIDPRQSEFDIVYFDNKTPLFESFKDYTFYSCQASIRNVTPELAINDYQVVQNLIAYILICLDKKSSLKVRRFMDTKNPGWNDKTKRVGILFPPYIVDMVSTFENDSEAEIC